MMGSMRTVLARLDRYQRRRPWLGFPLAVFDKFVEDRGPLLAGLITYYGFLSLFPLLLVLSTTLRLVLHDHPEAADALLGTALARFPVVGAEVTAVVHPLEGSALALGGGVLVALYGGLGFTTSVGHAFDQLWAVPVYRRPHPVVARARGTLLLVLLGVGLGVTATLSALSVLPDAAFGRAASDGPVALPPLLAVPLAALVNAGLFVVAFRALTVRPLTVRQVAPGALVAAVAWQALELGVLRYAGEELTGADPLYGVFGLVLALLGWIYLEVVVVLVAAEINTVLVDRLWPRALLTITTMVGPDDLTGADRRSLVNYARIQSYKSFERIDVTFGPDPVPEVAAGSTASPAAPPPSPLGDRCPPGSP